MSYIYQTARVELQNQVVRHAHFIHGRVLDVGASVGTARYRNLFTYTEYVTLDVKPGEGIDIVGSAEALPVEASSFDSIVCTQVLGDVYNLRTAFDEFFRVLKPGGTALITEGFMDPLHSPPFDFWRFTEHSFRKLAEDSGFSVEVIEQRGGYHSVMTQLRTRYWIERLAVYKKWYRPIFNLVAKVYGTGALWLDAHDESPAKKLFAHGYIMILKKNA